MTACDTENSASLGRDGSNQLMSRMQLNDNKAGMEGLDKVVINQIIYEASKGSESTCYCNDEFFKSIFYINHYSIRDLWKLQIFW